MNSTGTGRMRRIGREVLRQSVIILVSLVAIELILHVAAPAYLKVDDWGSSLGYRYDSELGWSPVPNSRMHNSLGLRDIEPDGVAKPTILFLGDSQVWGLNIEASERFSDLLRKELPAYRIVNAGIAGYGTDQEYLLLKRIWDSIQPSIVVLIFECNNDRLDNTSNVRYVSYKPYFEVAPDGSLQIRGQPPPKSRKLYFQDNWLGHHSQVARLLISGYIELRHPRRRVSDPTERLVGAIRDFVEEKGAKLLVGLQRQEPQLEAFLKDHNVRYTRFDGAAEDHSRHWTPAGNAEVAQRLLNFFSETGISVAGAPSPSNSAP